jgi:hypothetical protein
MVLSISRHGEAWLWKDHPANVWRTSADIDDTWNTMVRNAEEEAGLAAAAGPGHWNDPDMLEVGNGGMSGDEYRAHFSLWALLAVPLLSGTDLRTASPDTLSLRDDGPKPPRRVRFGLSAPAGWTVRPLSHTAPVMPSGGTARARFAVTVPADTKQGGAELAATAAYREPAGAARSTTTATAHADWAGMRIRCAG